MPELPPNLQTPPTAGWSYNGNGQYQPQLLCNVPAQFLQRNRIHCHNGGHSALSSARAVLHQPATNPDQFQRLRNGDSPRGSQRGDFSHAVAAANCWLDTRFPYENPESGQTSRENGGLRVYGSVQFLRRSLQNIAPESRCPTSPISSYISRT